MCVCICWLICNKLHKFWNSDRSDGFSHKWEMSMRKKHIFWLCTTIKSVVGVNKLGSFSHLYNALQYSVRKIWFFLLEIKGWKVSQFTIQCYQSTLGCCFCFFCDSYFFYWNYILLAYHSKAGSRFVVVRCFEPRRMAGG